MRRCLYCYAPLGEEKPEYHSACSGKIFGTANPPLLPWSEDQMLQLAEKVVKFQG